MEPLTLSQRIEIAEFAEAYSLQRFGIPVTVAITRRAPSRSTALVDGVASIAEGIEKARIYGLKATAGILRFTAGRLRMLSRA